MRLNAQGARCIRRRSWVLVVDTPGSIAGVLSREAIRMWRNVIVVAALVAGLACLALVISADGARPLHIWAPYLAFYSP